MSAKRPALGRGLDALIPDKPRAREKAPSTPAATRTLPIEKLEPNPQQPRRHFDEKKLDELATSIKAQGIIQPIVVSPLKGKRGQYLILAGERRWRAAQRAGLHDVPVVVRDSDEDQRLEIALVENLQRADLNPIEEARAYAELMDLRSWTHEELGERVGKDRSTVSNAIRLLGLPDKVQEMVIDGRLSMGHARALLGLTDTADMVDLAHQVVKRKLSVRATEAEVRRHLRPTPPEPSDKERRHSIIVKDLEERLRKRLGARVKLRTARGGKGPGKIEVAYGDLDELNRILHVLLGSSDEE